MFLYRSNPSGSTDGVHSLNTAFRQSCLYSQRHGSGLESLKVVNAVSGGESMSTQASFLKMRRETDRRRMLIFYCMIGLLMSFGRSAFAADAVCADNYDDVAKFGGPQMKAALEAFKGQRYTNKSNGTHLRFSDSGRIIVKTFTTSDNDPNVFESQEGVIKICEKNGRLEISSVMSSFPAGIALDKNESGKDCFRLTGLAALGGNRTVFCEGEMPPSVQAAYERHMSQRTVAAQRSSSSNAAGVAQ